MNDFAFYFNIGWEHIISIDAFDHLLFILALCATYFYEDWKPLLILITAFTIGHSVTLALSTLDITRFDSAWVEFLIPLTIVITALVNLFKTGKRTHSIQYSLALLFGLIHGMGFANTIRFMLSKNESIAMPLFAFNIGLEAGQVVVVIFILLLGFLSINIFRLNKKLWSNAISIISIVFATYICIHRLPWK